MKQRHTWIVASLLSTMCVSAQALAQSEGSAATASPQVAQATSETHGNILQEVVITAARKRAENVQTTPIAVTALSPAALERAHVTDLTGIAALAPNLFIAHQLATPDVATIYLRGFGEENNQPDVDPHVALFLDGIYQPSLSGSQLDTFDLGGIEVQAGPQGTLLGKNAPVGAIYVTSARPSGKFEGTVQGEYGSYDHFVGRAKLDVPVFKDSDGNSILAAHVSFVDKEGGNWITDTLTNKRDQGGENEKDYRLALLFTPNSDFEWLVHASYLANRDPQYGMRNVGFESPNGFPGTPSSATQPAVIECAIAPSFCAAPTTYGQNSSWYTLRSQVDTINASSEMTYRFTPITLTSLTGLTTYWGLDPTQVAGDNGPGILAYNDRETHDLESEEFRISSNKNGGWDLGGLFDWVVGGYFSNEHFTLDQALGILNGPNAGPNVFQGESGTVQSEAVFAHVITHFTDQWSGTFGARMSWDQKRRDYHVFATQVSDLPAGFHNTSFEFGTSYQFDPNHMAYFRFAQGYAAGGFSGFTVPHVNDIYQPELNNEYEVGFKSDWMNHRLRFNVDLFDNELSNLQLSGVVPAPASPTGFALVTTNAGSATVEGLESQIVAVPIDNLTLHTNIGYLHPRYNKFFSTECTNNGLPGDCSGIPFSFASKWTIDLGGEYAYDLPHDWGTATFSADWNYRSGLYTSDPPFPGSFQEGFGLVNLGLKYTDITDTYAVEFFGTNVLDRRYKSTWSSSGGLIQETMDGAPAEWGMRLTVKFAVPEEAPAEQPAALPPPPPPPAPAAASAPAPEAQRSFQVFFDFDKSDVSGDAAKILQEAADAVKAGHITHISVVGHTDTVGTAKYNQKLSERRAAAVKQQLLADGVSGDEIATKGVGKTGLLVPTPDGVREPQNRRAEIELQQPAS